MAADVFVDEVVAADVCVAVSLGMEGLVRWREAYKCCFRVDHSSWRRRDLWDACSAVRFQFPPFSLWVSNRSGSPLFVLLCFRNQSRTHHFEIR